MPAKRSVLIVEDDEDTREAVAGFLADRGLETLIARNGAEALDLLKKGVRPTLILLDLMMPVMDGWHFRKAQVGDEDLRSIPCVAMTAGFTAPWDLDEVLLKPLTAEKLERVTNLAKTAA
jgi:CheY-like chemotaxis protein